MRVVEVFNRERAESARFAALNKAHLDANLRSITIYALYFPAIEFLTSVALAILLVAGAHRIGVGSLTVGVVAAFLQLMRRFYQPLQDLADKFNTLQQAMAASERIFLLLDTERDELTPPETPHHVVPVRPVTIAFQGVWFQYGHRMAEPAWVLKDVSCVARAGEA